MEHYTVYMHTCPNGKKYIGLTRRKPQRRWGSKGTPYREHNKHFYSAIERYGWNNIKHEILFEGLDKTTAEWYERYYIELYKTTDRRFGYNHAEGGLVNSAWKMPETFIEAHGKKVDKYDLQGNLVGSYVSLAEAARSINSTGSSQVSACCNGKLQKIKGYIFRWNGEPFNKYYTGRLSNDKRSVIQIDTKGNTIAIYNSCADAERATGIPNANIVKVCKGNTGRRKAGGYYWKYEGVV